MDITVKIEQSRIKIIEPHIWDVYFIEQSEVDGLFYITSQNGYNGYEGKGCKSLESALAKVKGFIKNFFSDRGEDNPEGF